MDNRVFSSLTKLFALVLFVVTSVSCSPAYVRVQMKRPHVAKTRVEKAYHADVRFSQKERKLINKAVYLLNTQMNGVARFSVVYDLKWERQKDFELASGFDLIVSMKAATAATKRVDDSLPGGNYTLGWCDVRWDDPTYATRVFIVEDRIARTDKYVHVVMHEMLHSLRMQHVSGKKYSVLYWQTHNAEPSTCMSQFDAEELCRVHGCDVEEISYCE